MTTERSRRPITDATHRPTTSPSLTVERTVELDLDPAALWAAVATADGWRRWLVDGARFTGDLSECSAGRSVAGAVADGAVVDRAVVDGAGVAGVVVDGDTVREVRIDRVDTGRMIGFTWWDRNGPAAPSQVTIEIVPAGDGGSVLSIREDFAATDPQTAVDMSARAAATRLEWEVRVCVLWACTVAAALV